MCGWIFVNLFLLVMLKIGREVCHISSKSLFFCDVGVLIAKRLADPQRPGLSAGVRISLEDLQHILCLSTFCSLKKPHAIYLIF